VLNVGKFRVREVSSCRSSLLKVILNGATLEFVPGYTLVWRNSLKNRVNCGDVFSLTGLVVALADAYNLYMSESEGWSG